MIINITENKWIFNFKANRGKKGSWYSDWYKEGEIVHLNCEDMNHMAFVCLDSVTKTLYCWSCKTDIPDELQFAASCFFNY